MQSKKESGMLLWWGGLAILAVSAIAYLPLVHRLGYLNDDWYLMYDMQVKGGDFFHEIFSGDRPGRALLMIPMFSMFGFEPLYYQLSAYLFRFLGGLSLYWSLQMLWPQKRFFVFAAALLFTIYPGFLSQVNAIDYQSHIVGLFLSLLSVALTIKSIQAARRGAQIMWAAFSVIAGWGYLSQMEYFIGMEVFRFACVFVLVWRAEGESILKRLTKGIVASLPFLLIGGGFLIWRVFLFVAERKATDIGLQLSLAISSPVTLLWWLNYLIQDTFNVVLVAWGLPMYILAFPLRLRDMVIALGWAGLASVLTFWAIHQQRLNESGAETKSQFSREPLWLSLSGILGGLIPVILVNRHITFPDYSRYSLIASVGAVMLFAWVLDNIFSDRVRSSVLVFFVAVAVLTHYGNAVRAVTETESTRNFWQQVAWRAPQIKEGTTVVASYPGSPLSEDYFIWGPANFIYYPEKQTSDEVNIKLPATILTDAAVLQVMTNGGTESQLRRGNYSERDFGNVLVMVQTSPNGCVRVINGTAPELSPGDQQRLFLVAPFSKLENIIPGGESRALPLLVFGEELPQGWCYYYQKADLARQRGEWDKIPILLSEALELGYYPEDILEWMPFLQASAVLGDAQQVGSMAKLFATNKFLRMQACEIMTDFMAKELVPDDVRSVIEKNICK